jgi:hypothetical protein
MQALKCLFIHAGIIQPHQQHHMSRSQLFISFSSATSQESGWSGRWHAKLQWTLAHLFLLGFEIDDTGRLCLHMMI